MIIQIDDIYFNPLQIQQLTEADGDILVWFSNEQPLRFKNWKIYNLASEINRCIESFNQK